MECDQDPNEVEDSAPESPDSPSEEKEEEEGERADSSDADYVDSPEREEEYEDPPVDGDANTKTIEFTSRNSPQDNSTMEGELDFEDEVCDEKEEISKESLDEDSQKENTDQEKLSEKLKDGEEEEKTCLSGGEEDGQLSPDDAVSKEGKEEGLIEEGEDDGEVSDEDDLEEGEVKDSSPSAKQQAKQVCRFFNRGQCTWGNLCRFLHVSVSDRGNYNMFAPSSKVVSSYSVPGNGMGLSAGPLGPRRGGPEYLPPPPMPVVPPPPPPIPINEPPPVESAWERGLRHAKELMKKAMRRKEQEPDFEEKRLNLTIDEDDRAADFDKENDYFGKPPPFRRQEVFNATRYEEPDEVFDNGDQEARERWRGGHYENFEIRWTRPDMHKERRDNKERPRNARFSAEREKPKQWRAKNWREERLSEVQTSRTRADEWRDPWRRSKTPKGRRSRSRGRSRGSYSSVSSRSYSGRSSRSSYSYSRSSSRSSFYSSRSRSPSKPSPKRKASPRKDTTAAKVPSPYKRKPIVLRRTRSRSYSRSHSSHSMSHSRSSSSRSASRTPSVSRSRSRSHSYSRSLSMDSVSSASSSISRSTSRSGPGRNRNAAPAAAKKGGDAAKPPVPKPDTKPPSTTSLFAEIQRLRQYDKMRENEKATAPKKAAGAAPAATAEKNPEPVPEVPATAVQPAVDSLVKETTKHVQGVPKQQIKLTLLNKALPSKIPNPLKKEVDISKVKVEKEEKPQAKSVKRSDSPTKTAAASKRSTSSRRDELLKQLKAVEDAIARKRAKFS